MAGWPIQRPGMMRHGPFPGHGPGGRRPSEPLPPPEFLEDKIASQAAEMDRIVRENQRLAETDEAMRQELVATHREMQRLQAHVGLMHSESDTQIRGLLDKLGKVEADIHAGEMVRKELQQSHLEAQSLFTARQDLTVEIQHVTEELQKGSGDIKNLPEMHAQLDQLRQEHQKLRAAFEYEKGSNMEQVERMQAMENNLISMAREVEKLRADVVNAEKRASAPNHVGGSYGSPDPGYPPAGQGSSYSDHGYGQPSGYTDGGYGQASYSDLYGRPQAQMTSGAAANGLHLYGGAGYSDGYGRSQVQTTSGAAAGERGMNPYGGASGVGHYDGTRGAPSSS